MNKIIFIFFILIYSSSYSGNRFVRVVFNSNSCTEATIIWNQFEGKEVELYLDIENKGDQLSQYQFKFEKFHKNKFKGMKNYSLELNKLKPNTKYYFIIKDENGLSKTYYFETTSDNKNARLSLIGGGDSRTLRIERQQANTLVSKLKPHAVLFAGDFTASDTPNQWKMWFEDWENTLGPDGRITPLIVARGNHEKSNKVMQKLFDVPSKKVAYHVEMGNQLLNIITLNTEINKKSQVKFLEQSLSDRECFDWQIPQYHRPCRPHVDYKQEGVDQYNYWIPLIEKTSNVKLVLESDAHTCKWTWPIVQCNVNSSDSLCDEGFRRNDEKGIVYIGEGCWGAPIRTPNDPKSWTRDKEAVYSFKYIFVDSKSIEIRTVLYTDSEDVNYVDDTNRFELDPNLKLWTPKNGNLIRIEK